MKMKTRIALTVLLFAVAGVAEFVLNAPATLILGQMAGKQFEVNDLSYLATQGAFGGYRFLQGIITIAFLALLAAIWLKPLLTFVAGLAVVLLVGAPYRAEAYYDKSDYSENYFVLPNE